IETFHCIISYGLCQHPYRTTTRVFCIIDNCSAHRGQKCIQRLQARWPSILPIHTPIHASWLNQIEIYFSIVQRKVLTPNDFDSLTQLYENLDEVREEIRAELAAAE